MQITEALDRRTIDYVERKLDGGIILHSTDGHSIDLEVDENRAIQLKSVNVSIYINPMGF